MFRCRIVAADIALGAMNPTPALCLQTEADWRIVGGLSTDVTRSGPALGGWINETRPDSAFNLPLVLAFCVLEEVLDELRLTGVYLCKSSKLGAMMNASKDVLPWQDFDAVDRAREARNALAHQGVLHSKTDCLAYIKVVERELLAWGVLLTPMRR